MKNAELTCRGAPRVGLSTMILALFAYLAGCGRQPSPDGKNISATTEDRMAVASAQSALPSCPGTDVSAINFQYVKIEGANVRFRNDEAADGSKGQTCRGQGVAFSRKLLSDGRWMRERDRVQDENGKDENAIAVAHIVILTVRDRSFVGNSAHISEIGASQSFEGVVLSKWSASPEKVAQFNREHPDRRMGSGPEWTINGTVDERRNHPIGISCSPGNESERQGDRLYMNAGRASEAVGKFTAYCQAWFGVNVGGASRAIVKVDMGGRMYTAAAVIANVKRDLQSKIEEIQ